MAFVGGIQGQWPGDSEGSVLRSIFIPDQGDPPLVRMKRC